MRKDWKYIIYIAVAIGLYTVVNLIAPKQFNWNVSLAHDDREPYGTFVFHQILPSLFAGNDVRLSNQTIYELKDSLADNRNLIVIASNFSADEPDSEVLLESVSKGATAFISSSYYWGHFSDTLGVYTYDNTFSGGDVLNQKDTSSLQFVNAGLDSSMTFPFRLGDIPNFFRKYDTTKTTAIAKNAYGQPVTIRVAHGKGSFILNCTPLALTNIYMLSQQNHDYIAKTLSYLPRKDVIWTEYYQLGRRESNSPLRFILTNESLRWAYYLTIAALLLFMIFEAKRKQRIIPVMKPLANTSLEFVSTIGNLYYQHGDHKNMAEKRIAYLLEQIRTRYFLRTTEINDQFILDLANKSGRTKEELLGMFNAANYIRSTTMISAGQLMDLNDRIDNFLREHVSSKK